MRRLLVILLLAAFGLPAAAPLLAQSTDADLLLPACCRRAGAHHCSMGHTPASEKPAMNAICPSFPQQSSVAPSLSFAALLPAPLALIAPRVEPDSPARAETQRRISRERVRNLRGPPAVILAA